ncbi:MAG: ATP-dependent RNA helicase RhlE [Cognaticolwellia sp.]|jgi:ATP-dependent RNA helicase RhlE
MTFKDLGLVEPILQALETKGYTTPTPIQKQAIPILLSGKDLLGVAQTGTGKTAAFAVPIIQNIFLDENRGIRKRRIRTLVVTPTRELAIQIADNFTAYAANTNINNTVIFGGVKQGKQVEALRRGVDILVATPGRLLDLIGQGYISLKHVEYFVLDEADQMLDMGFINDIRKLLAKLPAKRQSLFFSATMPPSIVELSSKILGAYEQVTIEPEQTTAERVEQAVYFVSKSDKSKLLIHLIKTQDPDTVLVFSRTKHGADKIVKLLLRAEIEAAAIHGNKSQNARQRALGNFKRGGVQVLVATDIAARGIDVSNLALVVNYDLPNVPETYVHRIGRTGRAKASGTALSFCMGEEKPYLRSIQKLINQKLTVVDDHPFEDDGSEDVAEKAKPQQRKRPSVQARKERSQNNRNTNFNKNSNSNSRNSGGNRFNSKRRKTD